MTNTQIDFAAMSAADLAKLLAEARKAEKAKADEIAALPSFAFLVVMDDSSLVYWSGKATNEVEAKELALGHATTNNPDLTVFDICKRPLPKPRGRKIGTKVKDGKTV